MSQITTEEVFPCPVSEPLGLALGQGTERFMWAFSSGSRKQSHSFFFPLCHRIVLSLRQGGLDSDWGTNPGSLKLYFPAIKWRCPPYGAAVRTR